MLIYCVEVLPHGNPKRFQGGTRQFYKLVSEVSPFARVMSMNTRALNELIALVLWSEVIPTFVCCYRVLIQQ